MVNVYPNFSIFTLFLKNKNIISKIRRSKVTDYAALNYYPLPYFGGICKKSPKSKQMPITHSLYGNDFNKMPMDLLKQIGHLPCAFKQYFLVKQGFKTIYTQTVYSKTCLKQPLSKRPKKGFQDQLLLTAG